MDDPEDIIAKLEQAKAKLAEGQRHTFNGLTKLGGIRDALEGALGRMGQGNRAIGILRNSEVAIKNSAVAINGFSQRIDKAIAEVRSAAGGGPSGPSGDPAAGPD